MRRVHPLLAVLLYTALSCGVGVTVGGVTVGGVTVARAACTAPGEPSLAELSRRALTVASLEPERARSLLRRVRVAALLPHLALRAGRGAYDNVRNADTLDPSFTSTESWRFDVSLLFSLDRLIFDPHELRAAEAAGRLAELRAQLVERVAALWSARRDLDTGPAAALSGGGSPGAGPPRDDTDRCTELSVLLELMTGRPLGTVSRPTRNSLPDAERRP